MRYLIIILLLALVFLFSVHTLTSINRDIGRHLSTGELIWGTHQVPKVNFFSFTTPDFPVVNHHWLGQVFLFLANSVFGLRGLILFKAALIMLSFSLTFFSFYKKESYFISIIFSLISIFIIVERTDVRPEIFSFLFLAWYVFVLFGERTKLFWSLPIVQLLWVNTHIYFFLGPLLFLLFFVSHIFKKQKGDNQYQRLWIIGIFISIVNFINPFGWRGALYPLLVLRNYAFPIVENKSPLFYQQFMELPFTLLFLIIGILLSTLGFLLNFKNIKKNLFHLLIFIVSVGLSLAMIRNLPIFALTLLPISTKNFYESSFVVNSKRVWPKIPVLIFLSLLIHAVVTNQFYTIPNSARKFGLNVPGWGQGAIDFVKENQIKGPIFNNFRIGSFLIWKLPEEKVFIDTRPEAYPAEFINDIYIPMQADPSKWKLYSERYEINTVFFSYHDSTSWAKQFLSHILTNPDWPLVYKDGSIMIFLKNLSKNKAIIEKFSNQNI